MLLSIEPTFIASGRRVARAEASSHGSVMARYADMELKFTSNYTAQDYAELH